MPGTPLHNWINQSITERFNHAALFIKAQISIGSNMPTTKDSTPVQMTRDAKLIIIIFSKIAPGVIKPKSAAFNGALANHADKLIENSSIRLSITQTLKWFRMRQELLGSQVNGLNLLLNIALSGRPKTKILRTTV